MYEYIRIPYHYYLVYTITCQLTTEPITDINAFATHAARGGQPRIQGDERSAPIAQRLFALHHSKDSEIRRPARSNIICARNAGECSSHRSMDDRSSFQASSGAAPFSVVARIHSSVIGESRQHCHTPSREQILFLSKGRADGCRTTEERPTCLATVECTAATRLPQTACRRTAARSETRHVYTCSGRPACIR